MSSVTPPRVSPLVHTMHTVVTLRADGTTASIRLIKHGNPQALMSYAHKQVSDTDSDADGADDDTSRPRR